MKMKDVTKAMPILLLCASVIACGSTTFNKQNDEVTAVEEAVFTPTSYRSTGLDFTQAAENTVNAVVSIRTTTVAQSRGFI